MSLILWPGRSDHDVLCHASQRKERAFVHQAFALVRNFSSSVDRLEFGDFSLSEVGPVNLDEVRRIFCSTDVYNGDWVFGKAYSELPPSPAHAPAGVGGIPNDVEDTLFLLAAH